MMYRRMLCAVMLVLAAHARPQESIFGRPAPPEPAPPAAAKETPPPPPQPAELLERLSLKQKVAQLMMVTLQGVYGPSEYDTRLLKECTPGAVLLRQIVRPSSAATYVNQLRVSSSESRVGVPLLIGADLFELVQRDRNAPSSFVQLPSLLAIAAAQDSGSAQRLGHLIAEHLKTMGLDFFFGPNLELASQLEASRGSLNNFGSNPEFVAEAGAVLIRALREQSVYALPLGFPGGGANRSGRTAGVLLTPKPLLGTTDLLPFQKAFSEGVSFVHVANTLVPTIDPQTLPASQSPAVLRDLLRTELAFAGVAVAGPLDSEEIQGRGDVAEAAVKALAAGADMLYWQGAGDAVPRAVDRIVKAVESGALSEEAITASAEKVLALKQRPSEGKAKELRPKDLEKLERDRKLIDEAYQVERSSITLLKNEGQVLPLTKAGSMPIAITGVVQLAKFQKELEDIAKPIGEQRISSALHVGDIEEFEIQRITGHLRGIRTVVCVLTDSLRPRGQVELVRQMKQKGLHVVVVYLGYPQHVLHLMPHADAVVLGYCNSANYDQTLRAVADVLKGEAPLRISDAEGRLSAKVGEVRRFNVREVAIAPAGRLPVALSDRLSAGFSAPYDPSRALKKVFWDFGDGETAKDAEATHAFAAAGKYAVNLTITSGGGASITETFEVEVTP
ncbi:MAG: glycoside hydrolase family 3 protein [Candidatus Hydrogenedentes bacterium]|nr:glycoside hydrolase family 3 protein [Candidatus Hydrogenedentota bacterium]